MAISANKIITPTKAETPTVKENGPQRVVIEPVLFNAEKTKQIREITSPKIDNAIEHSRSNLSFSGSPPTKTLEVSLTHDAQIDTQKNENSGNSSVISGAGEENNMMKTQIRMGISVKNTSYEAQIIERSIIISLSLSYFVNAHARLDYLKNFQVTI